MITQVVQFKNLDQKYKDMLNVELEPERMVYIVKDLKQNVRSIVTSVTASIKKTQATS